MKPGARALGIAESYRGETSTLAGAVVRVDRGVDGLVFGTCTVGGLDATEAVLDMWDRLDRADVRHVLVAGVAPAWYNLLVLDRIAAGTDRPVIAVTFEPGESLTSSIREQFAGEARDRRLARYERLPSRRRVGLADGAVFVRTAGIDTETATDVVREHTPAGDRPEPLRVAKVAARAADAWRRASGT